MAGLNRAKKEEKEEQEVPKLTVEHFRQISFLYRQYGKKINNLLAYWKAVKIDELGAIVAVLDWSNANEHDMALYESFEPLRGIRYAGVGFLTYNPYNWCTDWLRQWEWWLINKASAEEKSGIILERKITKPII